MGHYSCSETLKFVLALSLGFGELRVLLVLHFVWSSSLVI